MTQMLGADSDGLSDKERQLADEIRLLGKLLGDTIREQEGSETFERIETIRRLSIAYERDADAEAGRALDVLLRGLTAEQAVLVVRAFSYFSHLTNIAEDRHYIRRRAIRERERPDQCQAAALPRHSGSYPKKRFLGRWLRMYSAEALFRPC